MLVLASLTGLARASRFALPAALGWEKCLFPRVTQERFGMNPARLIELRTQANIRD